MSRPYSLSLSPPHSSPDPLFPSMIPFSACIIIASCTSFPNGRMHGPPLVQWFTSPRCCGVVLETATCVPARLWFQLHLFAARLIAAVLP